jgi:hypothetical protein
MAERSGLFQYVPDDGPVMLTDAVVGVRLLPSASLDTTSGFAASSNFKVHAGGVPTLYRYSHVIYATVIVAPSGIVTPGKWKNNVGVTPSEYVPNAKSRLELLKLPTYHCPVLTFFPTFWPIE